MIIICAGLLQLACSSATTDAQETEPIPGGDNTAAPDAWSIPVSDVFDGGPGRDGIPALVNPGFTTADNANILADTDLVLGYKQGNDIRAYQHIVLDWHEIVNDDLGNVSLAVTYCPLTGTGIGWDRSLNGNKTTFGVSGLLYNTNLIPFDRATGSNWSQILSEAVNGQLIGQKAGFIPLVETDWATWKNMFPATKILSLNTGFSRTYGVYPYVDYKTNHDFFLFPVPKDGRLPSKQRVHTIVDGSRARVYTFADLGGGKTIRDNFQGKDYLIAGNEKFIVSFQLTPAQTALEFSFVFSGGEAILTDSQDRQYNIFGELVSGIDSGEGLLPAEAFMGYWFSIPAFYETELYSP